MNLASESVWGTLKIKTSSQRGSFSPFFSQEEQKVNLINPPKSSVRTGTANDIYKYEQRENPAEHYNKIPNMCPRDNNFEVPNMSKVGQLIRAMKKSNSSSYMVEIAKRVSYLQEAFLEEDKDENVKLEIRGINPDSLAYLVKFLNAHSDVKRPGLTVTPDRVISADWRESKKKLCTIYFLPDGNIRYVFFLPNIKLMDGFERHSGLTQLSAFGRLREAFSLSWLKGNNYAEQ